MLKSLFAAVILAGTATPALAVQLTLDGGWYDDLVVQPGGNAESAPFTFALAGSAILRLTDANLAGDVFTASDAGAGIAVTSTFASDGAAIPDYLTVAWDNLAYSRFSLRLGPGLYSFDVTSQCASGCPAGFGIRLDSAPSVGPGVPEPASWALLVAGFGLTGAVLRRRRVAIPA